MVDKCINRLKPLLFHLYIAIEKKEHETLSKERSDTNEKKNQQQQHDTQQANRNNAKRHTN